MRKSNIFRIFYQNTCGDCIYNIVKNIDLNSASMERSMQNRAHVKDYVLFPLPFPWIVLDSPQYWNQILVNVKMKELLANNKKTDKIFSRIWIFVKWKNVIKMWELRDQLKTITVQDFSKKWSFCHFFSFCVLEWHIRLYNCSFYS